MLQRDFSLFSPTFPPLSFREVARGFASKPSSTLFLPSREKENREEEQEQEIHTCTDLFLILFSFCLDNFPFSSFLFLFSGSECPLKMDSWCYCFFPVIYPRIERDQHERESYHRYFGYSIPICINDPLALSLSLSLRFGSGFFWGWDHWIEVIGPPSVWSLTCKYATLSLSLVCRERFHSTIAAAPPLYGSGVLPWQWPLFYYYYSNPNFNT